MLQRPVSEIDILGSHGRALGGIEDREGTRKRPCEKWGGVEVVGNSQLGGRRVLSEGGEELYGMRWLRSGLNMSFSCTSYHPGQSNTA